MDADDTVWWPTVCGNSSIQDAFWSSRVTINTNNTDLTRCFQNTVLSWTPGVYLWICAVFYLPHLCGRPTIHTCGDTSRLNTAKLVLVILLLLLQIIGLMWVTVRQDAQLELYLKPIIVGSTYVLAAAITRYEFIKGIHSGGILFFFWLFSVVLNIVPFRTHIKYLKYHAEPNIVIHDTDKTVPIVIFYVSYGLLVAEFVLVLFADTAAMRPGLRLEGEQRPLLAATNKEYIEREIQRKIVNLNGT